MCYLLVEFLVSNPFRVFKYSACVQLKCFQLAFKIPVQPRHFLFNQFYKTLLNRFFAGSFNKNADQFHPLMHFKVTNLCLDAKAILNLLAGASADDMDHSPRTVVTA